MKTKKEIIEELKKIEQDIESALNSDYEYETELEDIAIRDILKWVLGQ